ncbi:MAG: CPBP family intramembrane metalloprotease [Acidobacteria bacterium]|nr:MAG: CPBP family intramembrane metalloprotease [Acidobacteriota bacterium]
MTDPPAAPPELNDGDERTAGDGSGSGADRPSGPEDRAEEGAVETPAPPARPQLAPGAFFNTAAIFYFLLAVGGVLWLGLARGTIPLELFLIRGRIAGDLAWGLGAGGVLLLLWHGGRRLLPGARDLERQLEDLLRGVTPSEAAAMALLSGFAEELFFRGAVQGSFGWIWATLVFALMHTGPGPSFRLWTLFALLAGLVFAGLTELRGTLLPAILAHALVNGVNLHHLVRRAGSEEGAGGDPS